MSPYLCYPQKDSRCVVAMKASHQESKEKTDFKPVILSLLFVGKLASKEANVLNYFTVVLRVAALNPFPPP